MKRHILLLTVLGACCLGATTASAHQSGFMSWVQDTWKSVKQESSATAERLVRQMPKKYANLKQQVAQLAKKTHDSIKSMDLEQKRDLALELWRIRNSLDMLSLLNPDVLHGLTGMDTSGLAALESQVTRLYGVVKAEIAVHTPHG